jgi:phosphatidylinositol 4-kinase
VEFGEVQNLLVLLMEYKIQRHLTWYSPLVEDMGELTFIPPPPINEKLLKWHSIIRTAWRINPEMAIHLSSRFPNCADIINFEITEFAKSSEIRAINSPAAAQVFIKNSWKGRMDCQLRHLLYWKPVHPTTAIHLLFGSTKFEPWVLQFAIRSLENFPINLVFFYIPQLVQALRYDTYGT